MASIEPPMTLPLLLVELQPQLPPCTTAWLAEANVSATIRTIFSSDATWQRTG